MIIVIFKNQKIQVSQIEKITLKLIQLEIKKQTIFLVNVLKALRINLIQDQGNFS